jgi:NADPH:quinone reductase-like Zn-dependent oxidoreductase
LQVYATARTRDLGYVRCLGADTVFDRASRWFEGHLPPIDAVIDLIGGDNQAHSFAMLRQGGILISTVAPPDQSVAAEHGVRAAFFLVCVTTERLARIATMIVWVIVDDTNRGIPVQTSKATFRSMEDAYKAGRGALEYWQRKTRRTHPPVDLAQPPPAKPPVQKASMPRGTRRVLTSPIYSRS